MLPPSYPYSSRIWLRNLHFRSALFLSRHPFRLYTRQDLRNYSFNNISQQQTFGDRPCSFVSEHSRLPISYGNFRPCTGWWLSAHCLPRFDQLVNDENFSFDVLPEFLYRFQLLLTTVWAKSLRDERCKGLPWRISMFTIAEHRYAMSIQTMFAVDVLTWIRLYPR